MDFKLNQFDNTSNWINGTIGDYKFEAKHFDEGSEFGINEGRVSKLSVTHDKDWVINYDRGWDIKPKTTEQKQMMNELLEHLEGLPKRFENELSL